MQSVDSDTPWCLSFAALAAASHARPKRNGRLASRAQVVFAERASAYSIAATCGNSDSVLRGPCRAAGNTESRHRRILELWANRRVAVRSHAATTTVANGEQIICQRPYAQRRPLLVSLHRDVRPLPHFLRWRLSPARR